MPPRGVTCARRLGWIALALPFVLALACGAKTGLEDLDAYSDPVIGCAEITAAVRPATLVTFFVVDSSGSMAAKTASGNSKWEALVQALKQYLTTKAAGTFAGLSFFPRVDDAIAEYCQDDAKCGAQGGKCLPYGFCLPSKAGTCVSDKTCPNAGDKCQRLGMCKQANATSCQLQTGACPELGGCVPAGFCANHTQCGADAYRIGEVSTLPDESAKLIAMLSSRQLDGLTPTKPALTGGVVSASAWMNAHPDHNAVVVLATDGLPDRCDDDIVSLGFEKGISNIADAAASGASSGVLTFVIGVFAPDEEKLAQSALDSIALAGGTKSAFIIRTDTDVVAMLTAALDKVRAAQQCEYAIPQNTSVDLKRLVVSIAPDSPPVQLVADAGSCPLVPDGFHYDTDPAGSKRPRRIVLCPQTCAKNVSHTLRVTCGT